MSKKHYEQIAKVISEAREKNKDEKSTQAINGIASELCMVFKMENANFRAFSFLEACGIREK